MAPKPRRVGRRSAAGATIPMDIVLEILSWLPPRSLRRFVCVCTSWRAMIADPNFLAVHRSRSEPLLVYVRSTTTSTSLHIMDTDGHAVRLLNLGGIWEFRASVDSFVLLTSCPYGCLPAIRIINIATRGTIMSFPRPARAAGYAWFGFGRAARTGTLKVIRIVSVFDYGHVHRTCEVVTVGDGGSSGWRQTGLPPTMLCESNDGVAVNGVLHFLSMSHEDILCFDLEREEWTTICGPSRTSTPKEKIRLAELNDTLCITQAKLHSVDVWLLADSSKNIWVNAYTIPTVHLQMDVVPLSVMRRGGNLLFYHRRRYGAALQLYDPHSGKCCDVESEITDGRIGICWLSNGP